MAARVAMSLAVVATLALAACGGTSATPTPVPTPEPSTVPSAAPAPSPAGSPTDVPAGSPGASGATASFVPVSNLEGQEWILVLISDGSELHGVPAGLQPTITLDRGVASGDTGCNTFAAPYTLDLTSIVFGIVALTQKTCEPDVMTFEANYIAALGGTSRFGARPDGMAFLRPSGAPLLAYVLQSTGTLTGGWNVTAYQNASGAIVAPVPGTPLAVTFGDDGTVSGSDGCNEFSGAYTTDGARVTITNLSGTRVACPTDELSDQEEQFLAALQRSTLWSASETTLSLRGENGITTLTMARAVG